MYTSHCNFFRWAYFTESNLINTGTLFIDRIAMPIIISYLGPFNEYEWFNEF